MRTGTTFTGVEFFLCGVVVVSIVSIDAVEKPSTVCGDSEEESESDTVNKRQELLGVFEVVEPLAQGYGDVVEIFEEDVDDGEDVVLVSRAAGERHDLVELIAIFAIADEGWGHSRGCSDESGVRGREEVHVGGSRRPGRDGDRRGALRIAHWRIIMSTRIRGRAESQLESLRLCPCLLLVGCTGLKARVRQRRDKTVGSAEHKWKRTSSINLFKMSEDGLSATEDNNVKALGEAGSSWTRRSSNDDSEMSPGSGNRQALEARAVSGAILSSCDYLCGFVLPLPPSSAPPYSSHVVLLPVVVHSTGEFLRGLLVCVAHLLPAGMSVTQANTIVGFPASRESLSIQGVSSVVPDASQSGVSGSFVPDEIRRVQGMASEDIPSVAAVTGAEAPLIPLSVLQRLEPAVVLFRVCHLFVPVLPVLTLSCLPSSRYASFRLNFCSAERCRRNYLISIVISAYCQCPCQLLLSLVNVCYLSLSDPCGSV
ncbi:hypothetical protein C8T65DRAFT_733821, partial [Cerioporus squamosus]